MKWKAAMSLPEKDDNLFEKIEYLDLPEEDAKKLVAKYNEEGDAFKKLQDEKYGRSTDDRDRRSDSRYFQTFYTWSTYLKNITLERGLL